MIGKTTENSLGIFWKGEEVEGFTAYGLNFKTEATCPSFPALFWPGSTEIYGETGDAAHVNNLLKNGLWEPGTPLSSQVGPLPQ